MEKKLRSGAGAEGWLWLCGTFEETEVALQSSLQNRVRRRSRLLLLHLHGNRARVEKTRVLLSRWRLESGRRGQAEGRRE